MKCIFLDFDGVINNWNHFDSVSIDNAMVLKKIIDVIDAKIIVTSSNKYELQRGNDIDYFGSRFYNKYEKPLNDIGIKIFDLTPNVRYNRALEIKKYINEHNIKEYVIVDDELIDPEFQEHQVFLDLYRGLQTEHIIPILNILNGNLGFYPENYNRKETSSELVKRINRYYNK